MTLETKVGEVKLSTPLILGSGRITETPDFFLDSRKLGCAGIVTRSLRLQVPQDRVRTPSPRYAVIDGNTMMNCEWSNEHHWSNWRDRWAKDVKDANGTLVVSLSGRDVSGCAQLIKSFDELAVDAYEINISCSHSGALHGNLNIDRDRLVELMEAIRPCTKRPIWIKLSYSPSLVYMAEEAKLVGADAIVCTNTIGPGLLLDTQSGKPLLGIKGGAGGLSGRAIFPIALRCVYEVSRNVAIPVVGVGGIYTADDVIQMLMAGASAVQLYTAPALLGREVFKQIHDGLNDYLRSHPQFRHASDLIGLSHKWAEADHRFDAPQPLWDRSKCVGCGRCARACQFNALAFDSGLVEIDYTRCVSCTACVGMCKTHALTTPNER